MSVYEFLVHVFSVIVFYEEIPTSKLKFQIRRDSGNRNSLCISESTL